MSTSTTNCPEEIGCASTPSRWSVPRDEYRHTPRLRAATGLIRACFQREADVDAAIAKAARKGVQHSAEQVQLRRAFRYTPPTWAERLVMHGLATVAYEQGKLDLHPWARQMTPILDGSELPRVRIEFPGLSEIARIVGYDAGPDGRVASKHRDPLKRALESLCQEARTVAIPVRLRRKDDLVRDIELQRDLLVRMATNSVTKLVYLDLHPILILSHVNSWLEVDGLAARYEQARMDVGIQRMRDEMATCDAYLRWLAMASAAGQKHLKGQGSILRATVRHDRLVHTIGLSHLEKRRRTTEVRGRVADALRFCHSMNSLSSYALQNGIWTLDLPNPDVDLPRP